MREDEGRVGVALGGCCSLRATPFGAGGAEGAEGGGVAAGLGGEVAAEAEQVGPCPEPEISQFLAGTESPGRSDQPAGVLADVELGEFGEELERAVESSRGGLGAFGGYLAMYEATARSVSSWPPSKSALRMVRTAEVRLLRATVLTDNHTISGVKIAY